MRRSVLHEWHAKLVFQFTDLKKCTYAGTCKITVPKLVEVFQRNDFSDRLMAALCTC